MATPIRSLWIMGSTSLVRAFVALLCVVVGVAFLIIGTRWLYLYQRSANWAPASAIIRELDFERKGSERPGSRSRSYAIRCRYEYQVDGRTFIGSRITVTEQGFQRMFAEQLSAQQQRGETIPILINPSDPAESMMLRAFEWRMILLPVIGAVVGMLPICFVLGQRLIAARKWAGIERR